MNMANEKPDFGESPCSATAMRKASRRLTQLYDDALTASGLRSTQFTILAELHRRTRQPPTMAELAQSLVMDRSALGHNLRPLERDGLLVLKEGEEDRRRRHVVMTERGKAIFEEARPLWRTAQDRFETIYGRENASALRTTLLGIANDARLASLKE
jgi:DNA-binding MarR family transcriptional regulator